MKLDAVETQLSNHKTSPSSSSSDSTSKRKRVVNRALSNKVSKVHSMMEVQFKPNESSCSQHNNNVKDNIMNEICSQTNNKFSENVVKIAVKWCYESLRRTYLEEQEGKEDYVENQSKRRRYWSRRQRSYDKRTSVVTSGKKSKWESLSYLYMTELSDDPDDPSVFIAHPLPWRSRKLNDYIKVLDQRLQEKQKKEFSGIVSLKTRKLGLPSSQPMPNGPSWAISGEPESVTETLTISNNHD